MFKIVKRYFDLGIYSARDVARFVNTKKITPEQYKEITGLEYEVI